MPEGFLQGLDLFFATAGPNRFRSVAYPVAPTFEFIVGMTATNEEARQIGIAKSTVIISPMGTAKAQRLTIENEGQYRLLNHARGKTINDGDEKRMSDYDTYPTQSNSTDKAVLKRFDGPVARLCERNRILKVWHTDRDYAKAQGGGDKQRANEAIRSVYDVEQKDGIAAMALGIEKELMGTHPDFPTGLPTDTSQNKWDCLYSFVNMIDPSNTFLGVNRATAAGAYWRGKKTTAARAAVLSDLLWEAFKVDRLADRGGFVNLVVCGWNLFNIFSVEAEAKGYKMISNDKVPNKLQFGSELQVIEFKFGSHVIFVLCDPHCPEYDANGTLITEDNATSLTFSYGHVYLLNTKQFTTIFRAGKNFSKTPWVDKTKADPEGAEKADVCVLETDMMLIPEVPSWNKIYTHVG